MERPETRFARTADGLHIAYRVVGDGPVDVVYIAGWFSNVDLIWDEPEIAPFLRQLARHHRLIVFDRRGTGLSDAVAEPAHFDIMMDDIRVVMDACGSERAFLVGITMGASLACLFAATYPERSLGLALIQAQSRSAWSPEHPWGETEAFAREQTERIDAGWGTGEFERWFLRKAPGADDRWNDPVFVERTARYLRNSMTPRLATWQNQTWIETDVTDVLPVVHVPALVVEREDVPEATEDLVARLPLAELVRILGSRPCHGSPEPSGSPKRSNGSSVLCEHRRQGSRGSSPRCCSPTSWTRPRRRRRSATRAGETPSERTTAPCVRTSRGSEAGRSRRWATASWPPSTAPRGRFAVRRRSCRPWGRSGSRSAPACTRGRSGRTVTTSPGLAVAIASRVAALAGPSEILVSSTVKDLVAGSGLAFEGAGEHELKGVPDRWHLYRVVG